MINFNAYITMTSGAFSRLGRLRGVAGATAPITTITPDRRLFHR